MARHPEVHFRLKPKMDKNGNRLIYLEFLYSGLRLFYSFGQTVKLKDWNKEKQRVKNKLATTQDGKFALNDLLDKLQQLCDKTFKECLKDGTPNPQTLRVALDAFINKNHVEEAPPEVPTFFMLTERFINGEIKFRGRDKSKSSLQNYAAVTRHLKEFEKETKYKIDFETINLDFFYSYVTYLKKKKLAVNTIAKDISILKVFMGEAVDLEYTSNLKFKHKKFSFSEEETEQVYLTEKELHHLYKFEITNKKLEQVRDLFIFGAWVGLRISDYSNIKPENIIMDNGDYFIKMVTQKTKQLVTIPCNPVVLEIFNKYAHNDNKLPKAISDQKFNEYIKEVCKLAGFTETGRLSSKPKLMLYEAISSHTCRRSFATNYYLQDFPNIDLMKMTGHKTERSFLKYIRVSNLESAKRLMEHIKVNWSKKLLRVA